MVKEILVASGITVSYVMIWQWGLTFGGDIANNLRRWAPRRGDKWHFDVVVLTIGGKQHYLWRAVDRDSYVLDVLVQSQRVMVTDKLKSYTAAMRDIIRGVEQRQHKGINNRAENSHQPTRRRVRQMKQFKSARLVQRFLSIHDPIANLFPLRRDHRPAANYRAAWAQACEVWVEVAGAKLTA